MLLSERQKVEEEMSQYQSLPPKNTLVPVGPASIASECLFG